MTELKFLSGVEAAFQDDYKKGDYSNCKIRFTQFFENGKAVHITLNEKEVALLLKTMNDFKIKQAY